MRRRAVLIGGPAAAICALGSPTVAQQAGPLFRVGLLIPVSAAIFEALLDALRTDLAARGYVADRNIVFDAAYADGRPERLPALARALMARRPDVIVVQANSAVLAAAAATGVTPIVSISVIDPVGIALTTSLARPNRNITGFANFFDTLTAKGIEYLLQVAPGARRVGFLYGDEQQSLLVRDAAAANLRAFGIALVPLDAVQTANVIPTLLAAQPVDAFVVSADPVTYPVTADIAEFMAARRLPAIYTLRQMAVDGGLLALSFDPFEGVHVAADYVARILGGAPVASLPFQQPSRIILTVNLGAARRSGIELPPRLIALADEVIE